MPHLVRVCAMQYCMQYTRGFRDRHALGPHPGIQHSIRMTNLPFAPNGRGLCIAACLGMCLACMDHPCQMRADGRRWHCQTCATLSKAAAKASVCSTAVVLELGCVWATAGRIDNGTLLLYSAVMWWSGAHSLMYCSKDHIALRYRIDTIQVRLDKHNQTLRPDSSCSRVDGSSLSSPGSNAGGLPPSAAHWPCDDRSTAYGDRASGRTCDAVRHS